MLRKVTQANQKLAKNKFFTLISSKQSWQKLV